MRPLYSSGWISVLAGTSSFTMAMMAPIMPWNDTAQLNYLFSRRSGGRSFKQILHVARDFPIIRFDAAMTLAKKHYQRLWFPEPGAGGDIPSRSEHGMTKANSISCSPMNFGGKWLTGLPGKRQTLSCWRKHSG